MAGNGLPAQCPEHPHPVVGLLQTRRTVDRLPNPPSTPAGCRLPRRPHVSPARNLRARRARLLPNHHFTSIPLTRAASPAAMGKALQTRLRRKYGAGSLGLPAHLPSRPATSRSLQAAPPLTRTRPRYIHISPRPFARLHEGSGFGRRGLQQIPPPPTAIPSTLFLAGHHRTRTWHGRRKDPGHRGSVTSAPLRASSRASTTPPGRPANAAFLAIPGRHLEPT